MRRIDSAPLRVGTGDCRSCRYRSRNIGADAAVDDQEYVHRQRWAVRCGVPGRQGWHVGRRMMNAHRGGARWMSCSMRSMEIEPPATGVLGTQCWGSRIIYQNTSDVQPLATVAYRAQCCGTGRRCKRYFSGDGRGWDWSTRAQQCVDASKLYGRERAPQQHTTSDVLGTRRVGEAANPGPGQPRGTSITTGNGTSWTTILDWLSCHDGHVLCVQEHKVLEEDVVFEKRRALARGWKSLWSPAMPSGTAANMPSGGTAVLVRSHVGVAVPPGGDVVVRGQVAAAMIETCMGWMVVYSVYGRCGRELEGENWEMCKSIACHAIGHGLPWVAGGDWNFEPAALRASGWLRRMGADVLAAPVVATTHSGPKQGRYIDYLVAARAVAALGPQATICADARIRTHDAVRLRLPEAPRQYTIRRMVRPSPFPKDVPIGPRRLFDTPGEAMASARAALSTGAAGDEEAATILIDEATEAVLTHLEEVLADAYMIPDEERSKYLGRAKGIKYVTGPLLGPKVGAHGASPPTVRRLRAVQDRANVLAAAASRLRTKLSDGTTSTEEDGASQRDWRELLERAKAAISTGHQVAAIARKGEGAAEVVCAAYGDELKYFAKEVEQYAQWKHGVFGWQYGGRCYDSTPHADCDVSLWGNVQPDNSVGRNDDLEWLAHTAERASQVANRAKEAADPCEMMYRDERSAAVREWAHAASHEGAAIAHRWTRVPDEWRPETVEDEDIDGCATVTANPGAVVDAEHEKWKMLWSPSGVCKTKLNWGRVEQLPRPTTQQFRSAARSFKRRTGVGVEGITPADFDALDDDGIDACISIMMACEAVGYIPKAIALVIVRMIAKKDGGRRPIGLLPSFYRVWAKVRGCYVRDWERKWARRYFAAGPGKSAEGAAWQAAMRAEIAAAASAESASILWDLLKCFEHGGHELLAQEAQRMEFPTAIARMAVEMYRAERRLVIDEAVSEAIDPTRGFMAGCARALALVKVVMIRKVDAYVARHPRVALDLYVDDVELQAVGTDRIVETLAEAAEDLRSVLTEDLGFQLADDKAQVVASAKEIADAIVDRTRGTAGKVVDKAVKLGVEMTSGARRGRFGGHKRARFNKAMARQRRLMKFKKMGGAADKIVRRGIIPAATFGKRVSGVSNAELRQLRTLIGRTCAPNTKGTSLALKLLLEGDPAREANAATIGEWAVAAWATAAQNTTVHCGDDEPHATGAFGARCRGDSTQDQRAVGAYLAPRCWDGHARIAADERHTIGAAQLHAAIKFANEDTAEGSWERVRGPASAAVLTARRLGWRFCDGTTFINEYGDHIDMARTAPESVKHAVIRATDKVTMAEAAHRWGKPEYAQGIWVRPVRTALGRLPPAAKAALKRSWTGGYWCRARLADCALAGSPECEACGGPRDDRYHRIWECSRTADKRETYTTPAMREQAALVERDDWVYTRGLAPNLWQLAPRPRDDYEEVHIGPDMKTLDQALLLDMDVFVDGSALWPSNPDARRAGWSIVMIDAEGQLVGAIYGHLPWPEADEQTPGQAEMYALRRAAELAIGPIKIYTDYKEAAEGPRKGVEATVGPRSKHAAHWRAFWLAADGADISVVKVKGHITEAEVANDPELGWRRKGNALADRLAKKGARAHFSNEHWEQAKRNDAEQEKVAKLCEWIGVALGEWAHEKQVRRKAMDRSAMREKQKKRRAAARRVGGHRIDWTRDGWRCRYCGTTARTASGASRILNQPCPGHTAARIPRQADHGAAAHVLWTAEADDTTRQTGADVTWCAVCGAYSSTKLYKLRGKCSGPAEKAALTRLRALQSLRHPVLGYRLKKPHRTTDEMMDAMAARGGERRRMYEEAMRAQGDGDVYGSTVGNPIPRPEPPWHGAGGEPRTEPFGHVADAMGDGEQMIDEIGTTEMVGDENPASRLLRERHSARSDGMRAVPPGHAACQRLAERIQPCSYTDEEEDVFGHGGGLDDQTAEPLAAARSEAEHRRRHQETPREGNDTAGEGDCEVSDGGALPRAAETQLHGREDGVEYDATRNSTLSEVHHRPGGARKRQGDCNEGSALVCGESQASQVDRSRAAADRIQAVRARVAAKSTCAAVPGGGGGSVQGQATASSSTHSSATSRGPACGTDCGRASTGGRAQLLEVHREGNAETADEQPGITDEIQRRRSSLERGGGDEVHASTPVKRRISCKRSAEGTYYADSDTRAPMEEVRTEFAGGAAASRGLPNLRAVRARHYSGGAAAGRRITGKRAVQPAPVEGGQLDKRGRHEARDPLVQR